MTSSIAGRQLSPAGCANLQMYCQGTLKRLEVYYQIAESDQLQLMFFALNVSSPGFRMSSDGQPITAILIASSDSR
ncbi:MAG: hypothetical protein JNM42_01620 [Propionivibrio sp.]|uniref:hypothetical protein n=1 Tax=Propionivibrio sp. TaxID=2212460 RepID=UPI001A381D71|nr:hypothetical protein [Propionivibrio sp.]MBL8413118.1 hypothetical protein [Propionivibrio sp.]